MQDLLHTEDGDLSWVNGDLTWAESTRQHQTDLLLALTGEFKTSPVATVGLPDFVNDDSDQDLLREIRVKFARDGMNVVKIKSVGQKLEIDAAYGS